jgi:phosphoribosylformylglycinamidine synthase subunit PurL
MNAVLDVCQKWEVGGAAIGAVTDTGRMRVYRDGDLVGDMPVRALVDDCPLYDLRPAKPATPVYEKAPKALIQEGSSAGETLLALLSSPNLASRRPLFEQYDAIVQSRTVRRPGQADAAVLTIEPHRARGEDEDLPAIAVSIDCNGRRVAADPYTGTLGAVLECAANLACVGAEPLGATNNLNFANPEKPHVAWQLTEAVRGLGDACRALSAPIVGGNVSLYNEGATAGPIYPTPVIGMVGRLPDARRAGRLGFAAAGDAIALVGPFVPSLAASELAKLWAWALPDGLPEIDLEAVIAAQAAVREAVRAGTVRSAHDIAEGGLAVALAECCLAGAMGARIALADMEDWAGPRGGATGDGRGDPERAPMRALFGEGSGGFLVSGPEQALNALSEQVLRALSEQAPNALSEQVPVRVIGAVGGESLSIAAGEDSVELTLAELARAYDALAELFA